MNELQIASLVIAVIIGSGALTFFIRYNTRLCLLEKDNDSTKVRAKSLEDKVGKAEMELYSINQNLTEMKIVVKENNVKLSEIGEINAKLNFLVENSRGTVSRKEFEMHIAKHEYSDPSD